MGFSILDQSFAQWFSQAKLLLDLVLIGWIVGIVNFSVLGGELNRWFALRPRKLNGLMGIPLSPFLHSNWAHLAGNTPAFLGLGSFIILKNPLDLPIVTAACAFLTGAFLWLLGRPSRYVGASGVVFGYLGFCLALAFIEHTPASAIIFGCVAFFYTKYLWGLFPMQERVAWEAHLLGFLSGIFVADRLDPLRQIWQQGVAVLPTLLHGVGNRGI
jgi:membrane associated rhomboid family serine protease